jgi:hypothetical protein
MEREDTVVIKESGLIRKETYCAADLNRAQMAVPADTDQQ